jgi:hypothetical protein
MTVTNEISEYKLVLDAVQEVRWDGSSTETAGEFTRTFSVEKGMRIEN